MAVAPPPPESLDEQRRRVGRAFDAAVKECDRSARALQRQFHAVARAQEQHAKCAVAAAKAADERERLEKELRGLWGEGAAERMGIRMQELDQEMLEEREGAMDDQVAAGVFAPVLGRDIGELWPEVDEDAVRIIFVGLAVAVEVARWTRRHINRHQIQSS